MVETEQDPTAEVERPTVSVHIDREQLRSAAERQPIHAGMFERLTHLPENLELPDGPVLIVGENGIGKSVLARALEIAAGMNGNGLHGYEKAKKIDERVARRSSVYEATLGPAADIAKAIEVEGIRGALTGTGYYYDFSEALFQSREAQRIFATEDHIAGSNPFATEESAQLSSRQLLEQALSEALRHHPKGSRDLFVLDEVELGLSPEGQLALTQRIISEIHDRGVALIPTNNIVLYCSNLPRIDLAHPELGVHVPIREDRIQMAHAILANIE